MAEGRYRFANGRDIITDLMAPEGIKTAPPGSLYLQENGDVWRKETGTGNVGWVLIGSGGGGGTPSDYDLDYLGNFVPTTPYLDGDIIVGPDGVAYVCVRDTVNPPTPWPGIGMTTAVGPPGPPGPQGEKGDPGDSAANDAAYWLSTPHAALLNAQNFGAKPSGYVKTTVAAGYATPNIVAIIPLTDGGTGASTAPQARINLGLGTMAVQNSDNVNITNGTIIGNHGGDGSGLVNLNASQLTHGLVPSPQLGSGTANAGTYLRGDRTWAPVPSAEAFPSGLLVMAVGDCPPGWTKVNWHNLFLRAMSLDVPGSVGGADSHQHDGGNYTVPNHTHGPGSFKTAVHAHGGGSAFSGATDSAPNHQHHYSFGVDTGGPTNPQGMAISSGPQSFAHGAHTHHADVSKDTDPAGTHSHNFSGFAPIPNEEPPIVGTSAGSGAFSGITGASGAAPNVPVYVSVFICQKN